MRLLVVAAMAVGAVQVGTAQQDRAPGAGLEVITLRPDFYMIAGAGGNIGVSVGEDGVILVDSGSGASAGAVADAIARITPEHIRYIINTSEDEDHAGGNEVLAKAGESLFTRGNLGPGGGGGNTGINNGGAASIIGTENMYLRMSGASGAPSHYPVVAQPTESFAGRQKVLHLNGESIRVLHRPSGHTDGDAIVLFRQSDVIVTGDVFDMTRFPVIDVARGGSAKGELDVLNELIELTVPSIPLPWKEGGTLVIPGHGRLSQQAELVEYRDMMTVIVDRVQNMIDQKMTLEQIQKASPTEGWERRFGSDSGPWTTAMFVEAIYKSLVGAAPAPRT
jgi:glyoxylase-like metal-dependent hydrolase (beta-lactamase superfamily II)